jgi:hypothetical protein
MATPSRQRLGAAFLASIGLLLAALPSAAKPPRKASLRQELSQLKAQVTELRVQVGQLQSALAAQGQRFSPGESDPGGPVGLPGGTGLCADPCVQDSDGDGLGDCEDPCLCDPQQADGDTDGTPDCLDPCPDDPTDACIDPCRWDTDGDGVNDCEDVCPWDPAPPTDGDENGIVDCLDLCWLLVEPAGQTQADGTVKPMPPWPCPVIVRPDPAILNQ